MMKPILAASAAMIFLASSGRADPLLLDHFRGPTLATPGTSGLGFATGRGDAYVSGGDAVVGSDAHEIDQNIYSLQAFNPAGTLLIWVVDQTPTSGAAGVAVGWAKHRAGTCAGCGTEIWLEARNDRIVFDVSGDNGFHRYYSGGPLDVSGLFSISMALTDTGYSWTIAGNGNAVNASGSWLDGYSVANVRSAAGGNLSTFAASRSDSPGPDDVARFTEADVFSLRSVPEPASWAMILGGFALAGGAMRRRRARGATA